MKTIIFSIALLIISIFATAQETISIKVEEKNESFSNGNHPTLSVKIYNSTKKEVEKDWKKVMKKMGGKVKGKSEIFCDNATNSAMGNNPFDIYAKVSELKEGELELAICVDLGGAYMNPSEHASQTKAMKDKLYKFGVNETKKGIQGLVKEAEKVLAKIKKEQENLIDYKLKQESNIEDWKKNIAEAEKNIEKNIKDQETKKTEIEKQKIIVMDIANKEKAIK